MQEAAVEAILTSSAFTSYEEGPPLYGLTMYFPYIQGTEWVKTLHARGGWQQVDAAYRRRTGEHGADHASREVLCAGAPGEREAGQPLAGAPQGLGEAAVRHAWRVPDADPAKPGRGRDALPEAGVGGMGRRQLRRVRAEEREAGTALVWESVWDREADASEFTVALAALQAGLNQNVFGQGYKKSQGALSLDGADANVRIRRTGKRVVLVVTSDVSPATTDRVLDIAMR